MNQPHPHDEVLSALLDGEPATDARSHLAGCAACRARSDALDGVRRAVGAAPAALPAGTAERLVAAALDAWSEERTTGEVVPLSDPRARRERRVPGWALGAAAALAALLAAVPLLTGGDTKDTQQTASAPARDAKTAAGTEATGDADAAAVDGGDLGEQSDQLALGRILADAVVAPSTFADNAATESRPALEAAPQAAAGARSGTTATPRLCGETVRTSYGAGLGPLLYTAQLWWQDTPAVLLAYRLDDTVGAGPDHRAFVMARDDCRLLVVQGF